MWPRIQGVHLQGWGTVGSGSTQPWQGEAACWSRQGGIISVLHHMFISCIIYSPPAPKRMSHRESTDMKDPSSSTTPVRRQEARRWGDAGKEAFQFICKISIFLSHTHIHTERDTQRDRHRDTQRDGETEADKDRYRQRPTESTLIFSCL